MVKVPLRPGMNWNFCAADVPVKVRLGGEKVPTAGDATGVIVPVYTSPAGMGVTVK